MKKILELSGWIELSNFKKLIVDEEEKIFLICDIQIDNLTEKNINPYESEELTKIITMAFDIECDDWNDFPNPIKDFKKLAIDIIKNILDKVIHFNFQKNK